MQFDLVLANLAKQSASLCELGHIGAVPLTPREGILVEFTAKWLGTEGLRRTRKRWSGVFNSQSEVWEGKSESQRVRRKVQRVTEGEK